MTLPKELGDREYQSFVEDGKGDVARRTFGGSYLTDSDGEDIKVTQANGVRSVNVVDVDVRHYLEDIKNLLIKLNEKIDQFFM